MASLRFNDNNLMIYSTNPEALVKLGDHISIIPWGSNQREFSIRERGISGSNIVWREEVGDGQNGCRGVGIQTFSYEMNKSQE